MNKGIEFMHIRAYESLSGQTPSPRGGKTVAIMPIEGNRAKFSIARCGPNDIFNKKVGRDIAEGRLNDFLKGRATLEDKVYQISLDYSEGSDSLRAQVFAHIEAMN